MKRQPCDPSTGGRHSGRCASWPAASRPTPRSRLDTNSNSVPWRLIGETVAVVVAGGRISIRHRGREVASHGETTGRRQRVMTAAHLAGIGRPQFVMSEPPTGPLPAVAEPELLRPLSEYEQAAGGDWS